MTTAKIVTVAAALAWLLLIPASAPASGGTYDVAFCSELHRFFGGTIESTNSFSARTLCSDPDNDSAVKIDNVARTTKGRSARVIWAVGEPLGLVGAQVEGRLRRSEGYESSLFMADALGSSTHIVARGGPGPGPFERFRWQGAPQRQFVAKLECTAGPSCPPSEQAKTWVRDLRFTVADYADPQVEVRGSLFQGGWLRGSVDVSAQATDGGSGVATVSVTANSDGVLNVAGACRHELSAYLAASFEPCEAQAFGSAGSSTGAEPFINGINEIRTCASDFAGNPACLRHEVRIDNESPRAGFLAQNPDDPELIRVSVRDEFSGLSSGAIYFRLQGASDWRPLFTQKTSEGLEARVDSAAEVPGTYEFMATATDVAGNTSETSVRQDGTPMTLQFPLRSGVDLNAHLEPGGSRRTTVSYGRDAQVNGRLLDAAGQPLVGKPVTVDEDFGEGALIDHRVRTVITDAAGRWSSKLPAGPTRSVTATYDGDRRYLSTDVRAGRLSVRTGAKLGLSRRHVAEGRTTTFTGRVERLGARIPDRGKLVQLQYRDPSSGRWFTVRNPFRTKSDGRFRFKYGFGTHYVTDVAIRFRLKVPSEQSWPYRGTQTRARRVIVEARE